jgi:hypothetical protein
MIDNFELIKPFLNFSDDDYLYFLQIIKFRKDNPELETNHRSICDYYIKSLNHLNKVESDIKAICNATNSRATISINASSFTKAAKKLNSLVSIMNEEGKYREAKSKYASAVANSKVTNYWVLDVDDKETFIDEDFLYNLSPEGDKIIAKFPSKKGYHLVTTKFNSKLFNEKYPLIEIKKNNFTNLFIP